MIEKNKIVETARALALSCCAFLLVLICLALPISMIAIGVKYKDDCPLNHKIPIWLIVSGTVAMFQGFFAPAFRDVGKSERGPFQSAFQTLGMILNVFQMVWLIIGSVWIYSNYQPSYNQTDSNYCEKTVFLFSFWIINITYIGLCLIVFISAVLFLFNRGLVG